MNAILKALCQQPSAPFREHAVIRWIESFCRRQHLRLQRDRFGNLLVSSSSRAVSTRWVLVAHMDHPGIIAGKTLRPGILQAKFHGGVYATHLRNVRVVFQTPAGEVRGKILRATAGERGLADQLTIRTDAEIPENSGGMFDLEIAKPRRNLLHSRALDDLGGVAAALQTILNHRRSKSKTSVAALLTRAEEDGFVGAIAAARSGSLLKKSDRIISIETSALQPYAPQGNGAVIRVGDKTSIFDSAMSFQITAIAESLAKQNKSFRFQRALMPGGTCEATAFAAFGYRAAAVCIPLGNYHNMVPGQKKIAAEYIDLNDWQSLVTLLTAISAAKPADTLAPLRKRLTNRFTSLQHMLS